MGGVRAGQSREIFFEAQVVQGLEEIAANELRRFLSVDTQVTGEIIAESPGSIRFTAAAVPQWAGELRTIAAVYLGCRFEIARPKALLGDENFRVLLALIGQVMPDPAGGTFQSFYLSSAGRDSSTMLRLRDQIREATRLREGDVEGDLLIRVVKSADASGGWEVMVRLTPRPLSTRPWRVCNFPGALNATVAHAMAALTQPDPADAVLNLGCGSGSLLIGRLDTGPCRLLAGCDISGEVLGCAAQNLAAADFSGQVDLLQADGVRLPLPAGSFQSGLADLPFGGLVGSHSANTLLYPRLFEELARVIVESGRLVVLTHEIRLMHRILRDPQPWFLQASLQINLRGLHPRIYLLVRRGERTADLVSVNRGGGGFRPYA